MRVSTGMIHGNALKAMLDQQTKMLNTQQQLSSGLRILRPSDDPAVSAQIIGLDQTRQATAQFQENIRQARSHLNREDVALEGVMNLLQRVRELAVQGNNSSLTNVDRRSIALELSQHLEEMVTLANSKGANGEYLFAGYQGKTQPFAVNPSGSYLYNGDDGQRFLQVGETRQIAVGDPGTDVFRAIRNGNGSFYVTDNLSNTGTGIIDPGSITDPTIYDGDTYTISFPISTVAGPVLNFSDNIGVDDNLSYTLSINGTAVYSVSESGTPVASLPDLAAQINNSSATTGVRAIVVGATLYLENTSPSGNPITISEAMAGASDGDNDTVTGYFGSVLTGVTNPSINTVLNAGNGAFYVVEDSSGNIETSGTYVDGEQIAFNGVITNIRGVPRNHDAFEVVPSVNQDLFTTVKNVITALETGVGGANSGAAFNNAMNRFLIDIDQVVENISSVRARVGARLNGLDSQEGLNAAFLLQIDETRSTLQDLDYAEAITRLNQQMVGLEAAQKSFLQIQNLSLFQYI